MENGEHTAAPASKTRRKREMESLQQLGEQLLDFPDSELETLGIPELLLDAIRTARTIRSHGARRRQLQYIGKLMRTVDDAPIREAIDKKLHQQETLTREFRLIESLRDTLIADGDSALPAVLAQFPHAERQRVRKLTRQARMERDKGQPPHASRQLFRYLRDLGESAVAE